MFNLSLKQWAAEDIPTNKAQSIGYRGLSNTELLSIIIGNGTPTENAVELARRLLVLSDNSLRRLAKMRVDEICSVNGIGENKASKVLSALELAARVNMEQLDTRPELATATEVSNYMRPRIADLDTEEFWALYVNHRFCLKEAKRISTGGLTETAVDVRIILRDALLCNATGVIACHNHPSGRLFPSKADDDLTLKLRAACDTMRIKFLDHVIITEEDYYSYLEKGKL